MEGLHNVAKRELRFALEASIKLCFVQQKDYSSTIADKLTDYKKELSSQKISVKNHLNLTLLPEETRSEFSEEVGRLYGETSGYVHLTTHQILESIEAIQDGRTIGNENAEDVKKMNRLLEKVLACSLVLLFHSVPSYVAGDWLVESDGSTKKWFFNKSRFIANIDSSFDYKHERKEKLAEIQKLRSELIAF